MKKKGMDDEDRGFIWIAGDGERKPLPRRIADWVGDRMDDIGEGLTMGFIGFLYAFTQLGAILLGVVAGCIIAKAILG